jgi:hypothetical protein
VLATAFVAVVPLRAESVAPSPGLTRAGEYKLAALEAEVAGIHPHPSDDALFLVATNQHPAYLPGQEPVLQAQYRGKLLTVDRRTGEVVRTLDLGGGDFGGLAFGRGTLFVSRLEPPEVLQVELASGRTVRRIPLPGPAGGLEYDPIRGRLLAQLYVGYPHLAVIDLQTGVVVDKLLSDENAMDLALVGGDLLCTWASSFDRHAFGELRRIDPGTGRVTGRLALDAVHTAMAPLDRGVAGVDGFISLVRADARGRVAVRRYVYDGASVAWVGASARR